MSEGPVAERVDAFIQTGADPRHLRLRDARVDSHRRNKVVDRSGRNAVDVRLHHDRVQGLIDTAARLKQFGEERALAKLRDPHLQVV